VWWGAEDKITYTLPVCHSVET